MGYSMGGRLALELFEAEPDLWHEVWLLSTHLGLQSAEEARLRRESDQNWSDLFLSSAWPEVLTDWNNQSVFRSDPDRTPLETDFAKDRLQWALTEKSLGRQPLIQDRKHTLRDPRLRFFVGEGDTKFRRLYESWLCDGIISGFSVVPGAGHRLLARPWPATVGPNLKSLD
jgi:pimeloyl-ACP methyl ester carboxylesterase